MAPPSKKNNPAPPAAPGSEDATTATSTVKSFRNQSEIENFYRFVHENDLRYEALELMDKALEEKKASKKK